MIPRFRAWDSAKQEMFTDTFAITESGQVVVVEQEFVTSTPDYIFVEHLVIMQSTGLKDKNGKEIFEGDIVQFEDYYIETDLPYINKGIVEWSQGSFTISNRASVQMEDLLDGEFLDLTIIGNVYENPELLGVTE